MGDRIKGVLVGLLILGAVAAVAQVETVQGELKHLVRLWDGTDVALVTAGGALTVDGSAVTQPVSAASLPLPTGAATAALQLPDSHNVTVDNAAGAAAVNIQDGGNAITVDGTVTVGTFPDNEPFNVAQVGGTAITAPATAPATTAAGMVVRVLTADPCSNEAQTFFPVDIVTATTVLVATGVASQHVYICSVNLVTAAANNVAMVAGTGATCGTSTAGMAGGATAAEGWNFGANGGLTLGNGQGSVARTETAADSVCLITSAAVQLSGTITYVIE